MKEAPTPRPTSPGSSRRWEGGVTRESPPARPRHCIPAMRCVDPQLQMRVQRLREAV